MKLYMRVERLSEIDDYGYVISSEDIGGKEISEEEVKDLINYNSIFRVITPINILIPMNDFNTSMYYNL